MVAREVHPGHSPAMLNEQSGHGFAGTTAQVQQVAGARRQSPVEGFENLGHVECPTAGLIGRCQLVVDLLQRCTVAMPTRSSRGRGTRPLVRCPDLFDCGATARPLPKRSTSL